MWVIGVGEVTHTTLSHSHRSVVVPEAHEQCGTVWNSERGLFRRNSRYTWNVPKKACFCVEQRVGCETAETAGVCPVRGCVEHPEHA